MATLGDWATLVSILSRTNLLVEIIPMSNFDLAIKVVLLLEGGYVNNPNDSGGATNMGVLQRDMPDIDIKDLTVEQATQYYKTNWWDHYGFEQIDDGQLATWWFQTAINCSMRSVTMCVQELMGITVDGIAGHDTFAAVNTSYTPDKLEELQNKLWNNHYLKVLEIHPEDQEFLHNWHNRCFCNS